ncbi:MAG: hypothetical protein VX528_03560 [Candidatus Latescibacterota bacterium]|nr:hypothetical protein [Candidatus Latescibacterota bacterium]
MRVQFLSRLACVASTMMIMGALGTQGALLTDTAFQETDWHEAWFLTLSPPDHTENDRILIEGDNFVRQTRVDTTWFRSVASISVADTLSVEAVALGQSFNITFDAFYSGSNMVGRVAPALEQSGETFIAEFNQFIPANAWTTVTFAGLQLQDFWSWKHGHTGYSDTWDTYPVPGGENPTGGIGLGPTRFGYYVHGSSSSSRGEYHRYQFDNFRVEIVPAPTAVSVWFSAALFTCIRRRRVQASNAA